MPNTPLTPVQKALAINLDDAIYGSIAEIGAGQEVARNFFKAGGASGTIARSISAYDMAVSDSIYGKSPDGRYVSAGRLNEMLQYEYNNLLNILAAKQTATFFSFANTVSALNFKKDNFTHGWMGIRYQLQPNCNPNNIIVHFRLWETDNLLQQRTAGLLGVNLIYAAFYYHSNPVQLLKSLIDSTSSDRVSIDMINTSGPDLNYIDNRLLAVQLVKNGMSETAMFDRNGQVMQPSDMLYKKNILIIRGSFRPITYVGFDMLKTGLRMLKRDVDFKKENTLTLCEITMDNLVSDGDFHEKDFLHRVDLLCGMGQNVLISNFREYYKLVLYLSQFKTEALRLMIGAETFKKVIDPVYYQHLKGGVLEAFGRLFAQNLKIYLYPSLIPASQQLMVSENLPVETSIKSLYRYLLENQKILDVADVKKEWLYIFPHDVRRLIAQKDASWEKMVPVYVARFIKSHKVFEYEE
ncbi:MAG: TonB-dependent receptor [Bacteroidota bacterium]